MVTFRPAIHIDRYDIVHGVLLANGGLAIGGVDAPTTRSAALKIVVEWRLEYGMKFLDEDEIDE